MKRILIIGWYGTETIGDRAILASLLKHIFKVCDNVRFDIGSIYPFHTKITLLEDKDFYTTICNIDEVAIEDCKVVDTMNFFSLRKAINDVDVVIIGGGPFDEIQPMHMLNYAFEYAKKKNKKTIVYGCGSNLLTSKPIKNAARGIINNSDLIILRDSFSKDILEEIKGININEAEILIDPAVFVLNNFKKFMDNNSKNTISNYCAINLRDFPQIYFDNKDNHLNINEIAFNVIKKSNLHNIPVRLIPMHYFAVGGDDRIILNNLRNYLGGDVKVYNKQLSLKETLEYFYYAKFCIGMRFHSVVFQTILNGNNYILNYTSPTKGKTPGFINQINGNAFYKNRYIDLQNCILNTEFRIEGSKFIYSSNLIENYEKIYLEKMGEIING
ncbi:MAG: polysaccharide pyruvyl transferase family protein [Lachnospira sp.]|nr:polysaccharide pyruvyl transferase family protein [Lachnospira sp.]